MRKANYASAVTVHIHGPSRNPTHSSVGCVSATMLIFSSSYDPCPLGCALRSVCALANSPSGGTALVGWTPRQPIDAVAFICRSWSLCNVMMSGRRPCSLWRKRFLLDCSSGEERFRRFICSETRLLYAGLRPFWRKPPHALFFLHQQFPAALPAPDRIQTKLLSQAARSLLLQKPVFNVGISLCRT